MPKYCDKINTYRTRNALAKQLEVDFTFKMEELELWQRKLY